MAEAICSSFGSKSITKSSPFLSHYTAQKPVFVIPLVSFQHSVHAKRTRRRRPSLRFACLCANSIEFDVISTHEHSDGSFLFRFGDPSEVVKDDQLEEIDLVVEAKGSEDEEDFSVVTVMDSSHQEEVAVKKIESDDSSEVVDGTNRVVESETRSISEIESSSSETSSSSSVRVELLVSGLSLDVCDSSELTEQVDDDSSRRGNIELNDSVGSDVEDFVHVGESIDVNGSSGSVTQVEDNGYGSPATVSPCPPDHVFGPKDQGASAEIVQPLSSKNKELISPKLNHVVEVNRGSDTVKEHLIRNDADQREAWLSLSLSEHGSGPEDHESSPEITESVTGRNQEMVSAELAPVIDVPADVVGKETGQDKIEVVDMSNNIGAKNGQAIGDSIKSKIIETLSLSFPLEAEQALHEEGNAKNVEVGTQDDIMGGRSEREVIRTLQLSPPLEVEPVLGEEGDSKNVEVKTQDGILGGSSEIEVIGTLPLSPPSEAERLLDEGDPKVVEAGTQNEMEVSSESEVIGTFPLSPPSEAEPLLAEGGAKVVEAGTQNDVMEASSESEVIGTLSLPRQSEAEPLLDEGDAKVVEAGTQNDVMEASSESEVIGTLSLPRQSEAEPLLDEGDAKVVEAGTQDDVIEVRSESEVIGTLPLSPPFEAETLLDEGGAKIVEAGKQSDVMEVSSESEIIRTLPLSPPLEADPFLDEEGEAEEMEDRTENDIMGVSSDSEIVLPLSPPLEVQPVPDNDAQLEQTEIFDKSFSGTATMINPSSEIIEDKEIAQTDEPADSSDSDKAVLIPGLPSEKTLLEKLFLSSGTASLPHPEKVLAGGEDACFACQNWLGVADGVSQWSLEGVDHGKYAHEIMEIASEIVSGHDDTPVTSPEEVLNLAVARAHNPGSSTVLISYFDGKDLHVENIGDSGVIILRNGAVCHRSSAMFHEYNFPVLVEREDNSSKRLVERYKFYLDEGDIVVAATDGLFDNLYEQEIISTVSKSLEADKNPKEIAEILAMRAHEVGRSTRTRSPFSDAAQAAGYSGCTGGKLDDVVVVVSLVKKGFNSYAP